MARGDAHDGAPPPRRPTRRDAPLLGPFVLGAVFAITGHPYRAAALAAVGLAVVVVRLAVGPRRFHRALAAVAHLAQRVLTSAAVACFWLVVVVPASAVAWLLARDPLATRGAVGTPAAARTFSPPGRDPRYRAVRRTPRLLSVAALVVTVLVARAWWETTPPAEIVGTPYWPGASAGQPYAHELYDEHAGWPATEDAALGWRNADRDGRFIHTRDLARRSWAPPGGGTPVWFFGSSALFGVGQRDEHTIASEVARLAAAQGRPITPTNFGVSAYVTWQEVGLFLRLARDPERPRPSVVVFYHGANDWVATCRRMSSGWADDEPVRIVPAGPGAFEPPPVVQAPRGCVEPGSTAAAVEQTAATITEPMEAARALADELGIALVEVWQAQAWALPRGGAHQPSLDHLGTDPEVQDVTRDTLAAIADRLGPGVLDVSHAMDHLTRPTFFDPVHHNEAGARAVAAALWPSLRTALGSPGPR